MTLLWVGVVAILLGGALVVFRGPITAWNARGADAMKSEHVRRVTGPNDGAPRYVVGVGALILVVGVVLVVVGVS
ncbi:hypothetical protein [Blastococcus litoris]|uniref:hypothetical protein n=1 Tax=Blastococcus litoris TaxID=2171622 RepID=UPI000E3057D5|nr:hypothetical protein [Blastococcus litoris]